MVDAQLRMRGIADPRVLTAMATVPRELFVGEELKSKAYDDSALPIGHGQTISQPYMVARTCELARCEPHHRVLEVGAGSGYQAAVLARLAGEVIAIEVIPELAERATRALAAAGIDNARVVVSDGSVGYPGEAPFDRVVVAAGAPAVPDPLVEQLAEGGRLVIPVGSRTMQRLLVLTKRDGVVHREEHDACVFVPLVGGEGWR